MGEQPRMMVMIGTDELDGLRAEITALREAIRGATIKPRDEWERIEDLNVKDGILICV